MSLSISRARVEELVLNTRCVWIEAWLLRSLIRKGYSELGAEVFCLEFTAHHKVVDVLLEHDKVLEEALVEL